MLQYGTGDDMKEFLEQVEKRLELVEKKEQSAIQQAANLLFESFTNQLVVHVFATGHSHMFMEELFYRAGGLVPINPIFVPSLMQHEGAIRSTHLERLPGFATEIYRSIQKLPKEPFIIVSNSGINAVPVEMAMLAKQDGHPVIAVTSVEMSSQSKPRTLQQKRLYEIADIVIDNHVPFGDGVLAYENTPIGAVSSIIGSFIAQSLVLHIIEKYKEKGITPPIYQSANTPGGDTHNQALYEAYKARIHSLY
ncbi:MAG: SIS domain-containing protein [Staphylococcus sp.]|nr:SIS domain-containing protein [Staphylococcus sp.]